jgi:excisionase family DNA binding protein
MPDEVLTIQDVAVMLRVSRTKVQQHVVAGKLPHFRMGRRVLFFRDALVKWMQEGGAR